MCVYRCSCQCYTAEHIVVRMHDASYLEQVKRYVIIIIIIIIIIINFTKKEGMHKRQSLYKVLAEGDTKTKNTIHNTNYIHIINTCSVLSSVY